MQFLRNLTSRFKVGMRVAIGFASVLVLLGIVAAVSYLGLANSARNTKEFSAIARAYERVTTVESSFAQMRRTVLLYSQTGSDAAAEQVREFQERIAFNAAEAQKMILAQDRREMMENVIETFERYVAAFDKVVKAKTEQAGVDMTQRPIGMRMQQILSNMMQSGAMTDEMSAAVNAGMAQELLLSARLNVNVYFANPAPNIAKAALDNINKLPAAIKQLQDSVNSVSEKERAKELTGLAEKYVPGIAATIKLTDERNKLINDMGVIIAAQMAEQLAALNSAQLKALDQIREETLSTIDWSVWLSLAIAVAALAIGLLLAWLIGRGISKPLGKMSGVLNELANGNKAVDIPYTERGDEIGDNARAAKMFKENLLRVEKMEAEQKEHELRVAAEHEAAKQKVVHEFEAAVGGIVKAAAAGDFSQRVDLEGKAGIVLSVGGAINSLCENVARALDDLMKMLNALAEGELTQRITAEYQGNFATLKDNANMTAERIGATIGQLKAAGREVTNASAEISTSTTDLSQRTEEQAASLEETSASLEEISATVKKNAENAQQANQFTAGTREVADRGGQVVAKAVQAMAKIEESSRKISDIIGVIDEIARQTNLLALNAAVEAARAGEAGRGFAVVASEVRSLAQRASQAAKDIKDLITNSNGQVKEGVELVNKAGASLNEIVESIKKVADIVADIANASAEQATGIEQVNKALNQMDEVTQQNSALVEENAATAKTLEHQAKAMDERIAFFQIGDAGEGEHMAQAGAAHETRPIVAVPSRGPAAAIKKQPVAAPKRAVAGGNSGGPVGRMQTALATAVNSEPDWKEF
jgi:methyl-accepting chemotaxis protein